MWLRGKAERGWERKLEVILLAEMDKGGLGN